MPVDPMKPTLKSPDFQFLKLGHEKVLSSYAFKFNLRRYNLGWFLTAFTWIFGSYVIMVGRCRLTPTNARSKRLELST